ncbi:galactan 5-O-arabinofuranosyltransferase [Prauserella flava]|uniref:galactan 5-O-arabinofuranosyltransferase n=1 Tax=Prauserella flava TaxID=577679 RepID=UPI00216449F1|nr:galactan 5-O-arabinofuranosyltransferase [Prauserella flava]MCR3720220.1 galactan 5-O-arabinofuranosyltransferase [Prauserella flava]
MPLPGLGRAAAELVTAIVGATAISLFLQFAVNSAPNLVPDTYVPNALLSLIGAGLIVCLVDGLAVRRVVTAPWWVKFAGVTGGLATLATLTLALPLLSTRYYLGGTTGDNEFRLRYMERMASGWGLADFNYEGLPPFYPAGWFWLGGRFANLFDLQGWEAYKPFSITTIAVVATVTFVLWRFVVRRRMAVLASLGTLLMGLYVPGVGEPYAWPTTAWLLPVLVLTWNALRNREKPRWPLVLTGIYLGVCAMTYTLHLAFGAMLVVLLAIIAGVLRVRAGASRGEVVRGLVVRVALVAVVSVALMLVVWAPYLFGGGLGAENVAARYLPETSAYFPMPFKPNGPIGLLCLAGLAWSVVRVRAHRVALVALVTAGAVYLWYVLSTLVLAFDTTLLAFRFNVTLNVTLAVAGVFATTDMLGWGLRRWHEWRTQITAAVAVVAIALSVGVLQDSLRGPMSDGFESALSDYFPNGRTPESRHHIPGEEEDEGIWSGKLLAAVDELGTGTAERETVLSEQHHMLVFRPFWLFHDHRPHYTNPLSRHDERAAEIDTWAASGSPQELYRRMHDGPFGAPTMVVLKKGEDDNYFYTVKYDTFPRKTAALGRKVTFEPSLFESSRFEKRDVGPYVVIAVR